MEIKNCQYACDIFVVHISINHFTAMTLNFPICLFVDVMQQKVGHGGGIAHPNNGTKNALLSNFRILNIEIETHKSSI